MHLFQYKFAKKFLRFGPNGCVLYCLYVGNISIQVHHVFFIYYHSNLYPFSLISSTHLWSMQVSLIYILSLSYPPLIYDLCRWMSLTDLVDFRYPLSSCLQSSIHVMLHRSGEWLEPVIYLVLYWIWYSTWYLAWYSAWYWVW